MAFRYLGEVFPRRSAHFRGADERRQSEAIAAVREQGCGGGCGGILASTGQPTPTPEPHEYWLARYYCGAQEATITAETAAPRGCWPREPRRTSATMKKS